MKVRMKVSISGTRNGKDWPPAGDTVDVPDDEGAQLCAGGLAEPVADHGEPEAAVPPATAEKRGRSRPRKPLTKE